MNIPTANRPKRTLVTGGAGFFGSHLARALLDRGHDVTVVDLWPPSSATPLSALSAVDRVTYVRADVRSSRELLKRCKGRYDFIFHLAAQPISPLSATAPEATFSINVDGTRAVVEFTRASAGGVLLLASSACAYGVPDPQDCPLDEDAALRPGFFPYTESKQQAEEVVRTSDLHAGIARFVNLFGPADWHSTRLIPRLIHQLLAAEPLSLTRSGGASVLDFLYVADAAEGLIAYADHLEASGAGGPVPVFNFAASQPTSVRGMAEAVAALFSARPPTLQVSQEPAEPAMSKFLSSARAERHLGWKARTPRAAALVATIEWYRAHAHRLHLLDDSDPFAGIHHLHEDLDAGLLLEVAALA